MLGQRVLDGRVHLQRHSDPQAVVDDAGDLGGRLDLGLAFDQRRYRNGLRNGDVQGRARVPRVGGQLVEELCRS